MAVTDKATFILNNEYIEQVAMLNDAQAGQLFRAILEYANNQQTDALADPMVSMVFSFVRQQMDKDYKKYEETCKKRAENGKKGGRPRKHDAEYDVELEKPNGFFVKTEKAKKADSECDSDCDCDSDSDCECDINNIIGRHRRQVKEDAPACEEITPVDINVDNSVDKCTDTIVMPYDKATLPILEFELERYKTLANGLIRKYMNRSAKDFDMQKVIGYASGVAVTPSDEVYAVFDIGRAELLEYVFERAAEQERMTWKYIDGIMENYAMRDIYTVRDAIRNEAEWHAGVISA